MTPFLSHLHTELRRTRLTRRGATHRPEDVREGLHKEYARMPLISLPKPAKLDCTLQDALIRRRSTTRTGSGVDLTLTDLGILLGSALGKHGDTTRRYYPSGGSLFPVETYLVATRIEKTEPGIFHYNPTAHGLETLWPLPPEFDMKQIIMKPDTLNPSALIIFTSVWTRSSAKYGDLAYQHALIEAGHMAQNVLLMSAALDLETRPYAGFNDAEIARLLDLDEEYEQPVYAITLSKELFGKSAGTFLHAGE
jgi:SagB-type dehydrogenase family enzyme